MIKVWLKKYFAVIKVTWIQTLEYRANALVGIFAILSGLLIEFVLWKQIFLTKNVTIINGFTFEQLIVYIFFALMVGQLKSSWINSFEMIESIRLGELNKYLIRPISFFFYNLALFIGYNSLYFICYGAMSIAFPFLFPGLAFQTIYSVLGFICFLILSIFISYGIYHYLHLHNHILLKRDMVVRCKLLKVVLLQSWQLFSINKLMLSLRFGEIIWFS